VSPASSPSALDREAVLALIRQHGDSYSKREIARDLRLAAHEKIELKELLHQLESDGVIERRGRRGYAIVGAIPKVSVVEFTDHDSDGELIGRLAGHAFDEGGPRVRLVEARSGRRGSRGGKRSDRGGGPAIGVGDRALARLTLTPDGEVEARIIKKLGHSAHRLLGVVIKDRGVARIDPIERGSRNAYALSPADASNYDDGDLVAFTTDTQRRHGMKVARVVEELGRSDGPHAATVMAIHQHGVPVGFSERELTEVDALQSATPNNREDLTPLPLITIDPADARDHDDAIWAAADDDPQNPGGWEVIVAIADVAAYVRPGTALDHGAETRGVSAYFPDRVTPMLPERISNDLCSLIDGEPRPCLAVRMVFDKDGDKRRHHFVRGWMRSAASLSYDQAQNAIDGKPDDIAGPLLDTVLRPLWSAYAAVRNARARRAPLEIDAPERRILLDDKGKVVDVVRRNRFDAHKLVEEFMIQANVAAAETLEKKRRTFIYRVHDEPSREKIEALADFLPQLGLKWTKGEKATPARFNALMTRAKTTENVDVVCEMVLRSQSQAIYTIENIGHFGLNLERYAHFTSPIRRYADLTVHRALIDALSFGDDGTSKEDEQRLAGVAQRISDYERRAMAAERDARDRYLSQFLADREGSVFAARITGVTRAGCFLRLKETGADGLAPISRLGDERFHHDAATQTLIGEETGGRYRLGRTVKARLVEATPISGGLLFDILSEPEPGPRPSRRGRGSRPPSGARKGFRGGRGPRGGKR